MESRLGRGIVRHREQSGLDKRSESYDRGRQHGLRYDSDRRPLELLHTALAQNHNLKRGSDKTLTRSASATSIHGNPRTKNIPMVHESEGVTRPSMRRWNSVQFNSTVPVKNGTKTSLSSEKTLLPDKTSILPLTVRKNGPEQSTDNSFSDLTRQKRLNSANAKFEIPKSQPKSAKSTKSEISESGSNADSSHFASRYQSEELESDEEFQYPLEAQNSTDLSTILQEINDFQSNFVEKMTDKLTSSAAAKNISRTQQKILDYRDLHTDESSTSSFPTGQLNTPFGNSLDYSIKIQHDTMMSDYTSIRLRFASTISNTTAGTVHMRSHTGVLGFINRIQHKGMQTTGRPSSLTLASKDPYLRELWNQEMNRCFAPSEPEPLMASMARSVNLVADRIDQ